MMHLAYLDAGSGSLIVQAVVGGTAGAAVAAKLYWRRLAARFGRRPTDSGPTDTGSAAGHNGHGPAEVESGADRRPTGPAEIVPAERQPRQPADN
ncbi:hypothetical protein [Micromonospora rifamycinica]|uniref:Uncharacterized protein n=1 Tax=Micromonospora rifamycinica TaxID=291594 RepID=A0A109IHD5_9ACTN|nr:hypothetical protein [Micromonospora rifamycinica]KWV30548.1 hypothetical protein AWV63_22390 [Micromonospora rifamycinica]SCG36908.1 hypothetical protein GA0070623_0255 [Micromonospora rifamycinica]